jgi:Cd2+/Zn2+-exporting ATPase
LFFSVSFAVSFNRAMTLLVAASPCALALGTPAAVLAGIAQAARNGVLIKGGVHLENLGQLKAIAFDKTGTITHGRPEVSAVLPLAGKSDNEVLALAAAMETRSGHPLARAVVRAAESRKLTLPNLGQVESLTGRGLKTKYNEQTLYLGNLRLMSEMQVSVTPELGKYIEEMENMGKTSVILASGKEVVGVIGMADTIRAIAPVTMAELKRIGVQETIMLTGDNPRAAAAIAKQAGLTDVRADLLPENKVDAIRVLNEKYQITAMIGDGVNDAPALANATVGIAMGGAGTDVALETADVALMSDDLSKLPFAVGLGRATRTIIIQNLAISLGVIALLIVSSLFGIATLAVAIVFHEGSTIVVVLNALRLLGYRPQLAS